MGMAEEIVTTQTYEKLCSDVLYSHESVRFVGLVNNKSDLLHSVQKQELDPLLDEDEIKISINYSLERWRKAQNLSFRLGNEKLTLTEYDNVTLISIPYDGKLLLISTQPTVHYHDVIQSIISAIPPWEK
jgi:hypothetical protein|tara:strand:- start:977 stop:1366 length:390 start_codon:yes stop_codon:yes gene_type:complete